MRPSQVPPLGPWLKPPQDPLSGHAVAGPGSHQPAPLFLLLGLIGALGLSACSKPNSAPVLEASSDEQACIQNLQAIHRGLVEYQKKHGQPPPGSGVQFLAALLGGGIWPADAEHARLLHCPGVDPSSLGLDPAKPETWYPSASALTPSNCAYAARNQLLYPLTLYPQPGNEPVVACDNHGHSNHKNITNVLLADGRVISYELDLEIREGRLPSGTRTIPIGPDAPESLAELRKLSLE